VRWLFTFKGFAFCSTTQSSPSHPRPTPP
jgi:hypothetical protein